tara:strand:- start:97 stop:1248 length:1152 start_codon:yes stop_codon:yes gene_type:complete
VAAMVAAFFLIIDRRQDSAMLADKDMLPVRMLLGRENMTTTLFSDMVTHARVILNHELGHSEGSTLSNSTHTMHMKWPHSDHKSNRWVLLPSDNQSLPIALNWMEVARAYSVDVPNILVLCFDYHCQQHMKHFRKETPTVYLDYNTGTDHMPRTIVQFGAAWSKANLWKLPMVAAMLQRNMHVFLVDTDAYAVSPHTFSDVLHHRADIVSMRESYCNNCVGNELVPPRLNALLNTGFTLFRSSARTKRLFRDVPGDGSPVGSLNDQWLMNWILASVGVRFPEVERHPEPYVSRATTSVAGDVTVTLLSYGAFRRCDGQTCDLCPGSRGCCNMNASDHIIYRSMGVTSLQSWNRSSTRIFHCFTSRAIKPRIEQMKAMGLWHLK